jgi:hypothetical protein
MPLCYLADNPRIWDEMLQKMAFAYCTSVHATTGFTPFEVVYGRKPKLPADLIFTAVKLDIQLSESDYANKLKSDLVNVYRVVEEKSACKVEKMKFYADRHVRPSKYNVGDRVWLFDETKKKGSNKKIGWKWLGPYTIVEKRSDSNYVLKPDRRGRKILANSARMKKCFAPKFSFSEQLDESTILHSTALVEPVIDVSLEPVIERRGHKAGRRQQLQTSELTDEPECERLVGPEYTANETNKEQLSNGSGESIEVEREDNELSLDPQFLGLQGSTDDENSGEQLYRPNYYYSRQLQVPLVGADERQKRERKAPDRLDYNPRV